MSPPGRPSIQLRGGRRGLFALIWGASLVGLCLGGELRQAAAQQDPDHPDKDGRVMLNVRGGLAVDLVQSDRERMLLGMVGIDLGVAVSRSYSAYLLLMPQLDLRPDFFHVMVPLGFQYDFRLARGLFVYPRLSVGYSALISNASLDFGSLHFSANQVLHGGVVIPELGLKYVVNGRFNLGLEPLSFPVFFNDRDYAAWYRANVFLGGNF